MATTAENAQHEPHWPWSLTPVTAPFLRQSTSDGRELLDETKALLDEIDLFLCSFELFEPLTPLNNLTNSALVKSVKLLTPNLYEWIPLSASLLCFVIFSKLSLKIPKRNASMSVLAYFLPNLFFFDWKNYFCLNSLF